MSPYLPGTSFLVSFQNQTKLVNNLQISLYFILFRLLDFRWWDLRVWNQWIGYWSFVWFYGLCCCCQVSYFEGSRRFYTVGCSTVWWIFASSVHCECVTIYGVLRPHTRWKTNKRLELTISSLICLIHRYNIIKDPWSYLYSGICFDKSLTKVWLFVLAPPVNFLISLSLILHKNRANCVPHIQSYISLQLSDFNSLGIENQKIL